MPLTEDSGRIPGNSEEEDGSSIPNTPPGFSQLIIKRFQDKKLHDLRSGLSYLLYW